MLRAIDIWRSSEVKIKHLKNYNVSESENENKKWTKINIANNISRIHILSIILHEIYAYKLTVATNFSSSYKSQFLKFCIVPGENKTKF